MNEDIVGLRRLTEALERLCGLLERRVEFRCRTCGHAEDQHDATRWCHACWSLPLPGHECERPEGQ